ncbi:MAG: hypothetical protein J6X28_03425 [Bacilli bacterium]|nr:hypothetical protein [Bacilli bacterium]
MNDSSLNQYEFGSYGIFSDGVNTCKTFNNEVNTNMDILSTCQTQLNNGSVFMGPACDSCVEGFSKASSKLTSCVTNFSAIGSYLVESSSTYKAGDDASTKLIALEGGKIVTSEHKSSNSGNANQDSIYNYLSKQGFNDAAICGILANIHHESGFDPHALGDGGTSYGICQWHKGRWDNLKSYCSEHGLDSTTVEGQLEFLMHELKDNYPSLYESFKNTPNTEQGAYDVAYQMTVKFERPANAEASGQNRGKTATSKFWPTYNT